jgi:hypothetical protein
MAIGRRDKECGKPTEGTANAAVKRDRRKKGGKREVGEYRVFLLRVATRRGINSVINETYDGPKRAGQPFPGSLIADITENGTGLLWRPFRGYLAFLLQCDRRQKNNSCWLCRDARARDVA